MDNLGDYILKLEEEIRKKGNERLSDTQLLIFLKLNRFDKSLGISLDRAKFDSEVILEKINEASLFSKKLVSSYDQYTQLLKNEIETNGNRMLSSDQILDFIKRDQLDVEWGIGPEDVEKDAKEICKKFERPNSKTLGEELGRRTALPEKRKDVKICKKSYALSVEKSFL